MRDTTCITIDKEIKEFCKKNKINLSEWVNNAFYKHFFSIQKKVNELNEITKRKEQLIIDINEIKQRRDNLNTSLTCNEQRYIGSVRAKYKKGANYESMYKWFLNEFDREITFKEFRDLVDLYETQSSERVKYAISANKKKTKIATTFG